MKTFATGVAVAMFIAVAAMVAGCGGDDAEKASSTVAPSAVGGGAGVIADQASVDLGKVPLDRMITQTWRLRNDGSGKAQLGKPKIEALEGC